MAAATAPDFPDPARSSRRTVRADLQTLPGRRQVDMAARLGIPVDYATGRTIPTYAEKTIEQALADGDITRQRYNQLTRTNRQGQPSRLPTDTIRIRTGAAPETRHADFTGFGDAEVQARIARQMAENQIALERKYGKQFAEIAREQQEASDPEGAEARRLLASEINRIEDERGQAQRPVADLLDSQMIEELQKGKGTTGDVDAAVAQVLARRGEGGTGGTVTGQDIGEEMATGEQGQRRLNKRVQQAMSYLSSGATPEDVDYRRRQQSMANMSSFLGGRTPQAQFGNLSGGQQGATPIVRGQALPQSNPNSLAIGQNAAVQQANMGAQNAANNVNGWFAGLAALTRGVQAYGAARG